MIRLICASCVLLAITGFRPPWKTEVYIQDFKRLVYFVDSVAEVNENNRLARLRLTPSGEILCDVYVGNTMIESGIYRAGMDVYRHYIQVPISNSGYDMMDSAIIYPVYKREGNWIGPLSGQNIFYINGEAVGEEDHAIYIHPLGEKILLKQGSGELQLGNNRYIFRSNTMGDIIQYWKISGYADWETGYFSLSKSTYQEKQKAVTVDRMNVIQIKDSVFLTPVYVTFEE